MITIYEKTVEYFNVYSNVQDHKIKFWFQSQVIGFDTSSFERKGKYFDSEEKLRLLKTWKMMWKKITKI